MSLILEALKKSEAERRLGQVPGLMTPVQRTAPRRRVPWPWIFTVLVLLAVAALGWRWMEMQEAAESAQVPARGAAPDAAPADEAAPDAIDDGTAPSRTTAPVPAPRVAAPATPALSRAAQLPSDPDFASTERESRPVPAQSPPPMELPEPAPRAAPAPARQTPAVTTPAAPASVAATPTQSPAVPTTPSLAADPARAVSDAPEAPLEYLPRLADLEAAERDALPPLKLTMHVYAADPAARFVLIDGKRLTEGERLSRALALTQIRRDGAVFEFDGRRFLIPRL